MKKENIVMADCEGSEIMSLIEALENNKSQKFEIKSKICNGKHSKIGNVFRYITYAVYPVKFFISRKKYNYIIGWQQFFALFYAFYCNLFKVKKVNNIIVLNFTYKHKEGKLGKIYRRFMKYCLNNQYIDYIHVPSDNYSKKCAEEFNIPIQKFIVIPFGIQDEYEKWKNTKVEYEDYSLALGRSNRDYDFLIDVWQEIPKENKLIIICDTYKPKDKLPDNIILKTDVVGEGQFQYIANCKLMIIPIKDENICSGDTVLLRTMSFYKPTVITAPSTLAETYIKNNENGVCVKKELTEFRDTIINLLSDEKKLQRIGQEARKSFETNYSRYSMGEKISVHIK